ncbi:bifunctional diguanylate cyclase/phosphodiesterase [Bradyrhizobium sp.]|uniref:bifunctional diguanylate cyclase/phosphodiesterase n=1 Tax=Bradyrhizobium sp. TaxID=376 RepID=UPI003C74312B
MGWTIAKGGAAATGAASEVDLTVTNSQPQRNPIRALILCGVFLISAIAVGTSMMIYGFRERALQSSMRELENTVLLLARHFDQQFDDFALVQQDIINQLNLGMITSPQDFKREMSSEDAHQMLKNKIGALSYMGNLTLLDSEGNLINWSLGWPAPKANLADRGYFQALKSNTAPDQKYLEAVHSRMSGRWTTLLSRRLVGRSGEFLGVVSRGIEPATFEKFFESLSLGKDATIVMMHGDGTLLARYPHLESMIGQNFRSGPMFQLMLSKGGRATARFIAPTDGVERLGASLQLANFPIVLLATNSVSAALSDWREQTRLMIGVATLSVVLIGSILFLIVQRLLRQRRASERRISLEKESLDTAINAMSQGLVLFDSENRLVVCNQSYTAMYGLSPDVVKRGLSLGELLQHHKDTGSLQADVDEHCALVLDRVASEKVQIASVGDGRWVQITHQKAVNGGWVATHEDITERRKAEEKIAHLAHFDTLTDLPNRVLFREQLELELKRIRRSGQLAVLYIDIDEFKSINDSLGHPVGDELLKTVAARLRHCVRETDFVSRLGGDEFAIVQTLVQRPEDVTDLISRIYSVIREPYECLGHQLSTDASIGVALAPQDGADLDELLKNADLAMYGAKADGRRTYRFFEQDMDARIKTRRMLEQDLRKMTADGGFTEGGFDIHYQPLVNLRDNEVSGCEALLRWRHPVRGMISPAEFIPIAEESGLISQLGEWVLTKACAEAATWPKNIKLAVNVSPVQFRNHAFALKVASTLAESGLPASRLELEITEAVLIRDDEVALTVLHQLRAVGVRVALDDFGTGYSSLSYLQRFPFDKIKIDRSFVNDIVESDGSCAIIQAVVNIAAARNMTTTAEGVETELQRDLLRRLGCTEMQGYLFSPARPAAEVVALFGDQRPAAA